jgi:hypothetical protein
LIISNHLKKKLNKKKSGVFAKTLHILLSLLRARAVLSIIISTVMIREENANHNKATTAVSKEVRLRAALLFHENEVPRSSNSYIDDSEMSDSVQSARSEQNTPTLTRIGSYIDSPGACVVAEVQFQTDRWSLKRAVRRSSPLGKLIGQRVGAFEKLGHVGALKEFVATEVTYASRLTTLVRRREI